MNTAMMIRSLLISIIILSFPFSAAATAILIRNNYSYTVWAAAVPGGGRELKQGQAWLLNIAAAKPGRVWARTGCHFGPDGLGKCQSGDCGGRLECRDKGRPPNTVVEYWLGGGAGTTDSFYLSVLEGFNVLVGFEYSAAAKCDTVAASSKCNVDVNRACPMELRDPGGCNNPCTVFKNAQFCCSTLESACEATSYSKFFKSLCPDAVTYPSDHGIRIACPYATDYNIVFCPSNLTDSIQPSELSPLGVCYSPLSGGDDELPAAEVIGLYEQYNISRMRIYEPNQAILEALRGTDIELVLGVPNPDVPMLASRQAAADAWVKNNVGGYSDVKFKYVVVGNEIHSDQIRYLVPAMENIQTEISSSGLSDRIKVSTCVGTSVLGRSFPPSAGSFSSDYEPFMKSLSSFLANNSSPLLLNMYPYFSYSANPSSITLDYALFTAQEFMVKDGEFSYQNLFDAILDSFYSALEKSGGESLEIVVSETGWPYTIEDDSAWIYIKNLARHVKEGMPRRPGSQLKLTYTPCLMIQ